jgi:hypothetical protein
MYSGISTALVSGIPGVPALLSAAEMLHSKFPKISASFLHYAAALIENELATGGSNSGQAAALSQLRQSAQGLVPASSDELERFGDALLSFVEPKTQTDFYSLAYLAYAATSLLGAPTARISQKIAKAQRFISGSADNFNSAKPHGPVNPTFGENPTFSTPGLGPPTFSPGAGGPPTFSPGVGGPPTFSPGVGGPPTFSPGLGGPPTFSPDPVGYPSLSDSLSPDFETGPLPSAGANVKADQLIALALNAIRAGADNIAFTALHGAISEYQRA